MFGFEGARRSVEKRTAERIATERSEILWDEVPKRFCKVTGAILEAIWPLRNATAPTVCAFSSVGRATDS